MKQTDDPQRTDVSRRAFLATSAGTLALAVLDDCCGTAHAAPKLGTHHVAADKNLDPAWVARLFAKGEPKVYRGEALDCIGMPIGGICAGQLYLRGDGTLAEWGIFNVDRFSGYGENNYRTYTPPSPVEHGFGLFITSDDSQPIYRRLDKRGFPQVEFSGEYPIGKVRYPAAQGDRLPVEVTLEAFSPFVPLDARASATPGTILSFSVRNTSQQRIGVALGSWIRNPLGERLIGRYPIMRTNRVVRSDGITSLFLGMKERPLPAPGERRPPEVFADFESGTYGHWKKTGTAFGPSPAQGTLPNQQKVSGYGGHGLVNTYFGGDGSKGRLTSPAFTIRRPYIQFRIGGGHRPGEACINLLSQGKLVRTATGANNEKLEWDFLEVSDLIGKEAHIEIVDEATGGWGHINIDDIRFADEPPAGVKHLRFDQQPDVGTLALSVLDEHSPGFAGGFERFRDTGDYRGLEKSSDSLEFNVDAPQTDAGLVAEFNLEPGAIHDVTFLLTWHFARGEHGRMYGNWFSNALEVAKHLAKEQHRLTQLTHLFQETYFDSTLPRWFLERIFKPVSTLATNTVQWRRNGRFWAWEGVGCCDGTCTHVWNYAQAMGRLFPELERSARVMQDLGVGFDAKTGRVGFRGENPSQPYAADGQCGTVLKCYREHLTSKDDHFLREHWPKIKKVMEYEIGRDGNDDGVIDDKQWNTYDLAFVGPNTFVGALYLAALEAAARMAELCGDGQFAARCRGIAQRGSRWSAEHLWNGEYFVQRIPPGESPNLQYGEGCLADQLLGQTWANQLGLGPLYPLDKIRTALQSIYRYNWAANVAAQNQAHPPQRWFARPGDAGLFTCTWPKGGRMAEPILYRDEVWTGSEYEVASALLHESMIREGLSIVAGVDDRYDGRRHNPWNEVECGDHYARALSSWGCLISLAGFEYDGPAGKLGFAPRWQHDNFKAFFTAAEGWGTLEQLRQGHTQTNRVSVRHGQVRIAEVTLELPDAVKQYRADLELEDRRLVPRTRQNGTRIVLTLDQPVSITAGQTITVTLG